MNMNWGGYFPIPILKKRKQLQPGMVVYTFNHNTQEVERQVDLCELKTILVYIFNPGLYSKTLSQTNKLRSPSNLGNRTKGIVHSNALFNIKCTVKPPPLPQAPLTCPFPPPHPPILPPSHWVQSGYYGRLECWLILLTWPCADLIHISMAVESSWM